MTLTRLNDRHAIALELNEQKATWEKVNSLPEVIAARAKSRAAQEAYNAAQEEFSSIFALHTKKGAAARLAKRYPGVLLLGDDELDDDFKWIARCAVTGLPIFAGDSVYIGGGEETYERSYILADAVTLKSGYEKDPVIVNQDGVTADYEE